MSNKGSLPISAIRDRTDVRGQYLVRNKVLRTAKNGKAYLAIDLGDTTGTVSARVWDEAERFDKLCDLGDVVSVAGRATSFQGQIQVNLDAIERVPPEAIVLEDFLPSSDFDLDDMYARLRAVALDVGNPWVRRLLLSILDEPGFSARLRVAPAAKMVHHAYLGGLVEHALSMSLVALHLHAHYERLYPGLLDRDYLVAGALLHDLGKVLEIGVNAGFDYTPAGQLLGHIVQGVGLVSRHIEAIEGFPEEIALRLQHLIVAHHGKMEFGSPRTPAMAEALVLHHIDLLDARMNGLDSLFRAEQGHEFTRYDRILEGAYANPYAGMETAEGEAVLPARDPRWFEASEEPPAEASAEPLPRKARKEPGEGSGGGSNLSLF